MPTSASSFGRRRPFTINASPPQIQPARLAAQLLLRRWPLYATACAVAFVLQIVLYHAASALGLGLLDVFFASAIVTPLLDAVVVVNVGADATGACEEAGWRVHRITERAWALIAISAICSVIGSVGLNALISKDALNWGMGVMVVFMAAMLSYAEPYAALQDQVSLLTVVPFALVRSMMLAWINFGRVVTFFALTLLAAIGDVGLASAVQRAHAPAAAYWEFAYWTVIGTIAIAYFTTAYLETLRQERETLSG